MSLLDRPARKQATSVQGQDGHEQDGPGEYNIWYNKRGGSKRKDRDSVTASTTKCDVQLDTGKTRAGKDANFCIHFARGKCILGGNCAYQHRIPALEDEERVQRDQSSDCFGRDRHETYRDDMKGAGSFSRENKSILITGLRMDKPVEAALRTSFSEYGPVDRVYVVPDKAIAFVRYKWRASAEFGKEAMDGQLINGTPVGTKWAMEDPNPSQKHREQVLTHRKAEDAVAKRLRTLSGHDQAALSFELTGQYPNTNSQYSNTNNNSQYSNIDPQYPNTDSQYPNTDSQYPNTDSQYPNISAQYSNTNSYYNHPNTNSQYPNTDSQYPNTNLQYPNSDFQFSNANLQHLQPKKEEKPAASEGLLAIGNYSDGDDDE